MSFKQMLENNRRLGDLDFVPTDALIKRVAEAEDIADLLATLQDIYELPER